MGYACPVCGERQVDGEHLANHVAFTAILRSDEHRRWLDEHVPGWGDLDPEALADRVTPHAESVDVTIPEETAEQAPTRPAIEERKPQARRDLSARDREILEEARELTRRMLEESGDGGKVEKETEATPEEEQSEEREETPETEPPDRGSPDGDPEPPEHSSAEDTPSSSDPDSETN
ncbi:MAG: DUF5810 domain-containing protein [Halodesulfurarchaeum sp.]